LIGWRAGFCVGAALPTIFFLSPVDLTHPLLQPSPTSFLLLSARSEAVALFLIYLFSTMFRSAIVRSLRASAPRVAVKTPAPFQIRSSPIAVRASQFTPCFINQGVRCYSAPAGLNKSEVEGRIVNLLKNFDKVRRDCFSSSMENH
jgi:hypothetical protein